MPKNLGKIYFRYFHFLQSFPPFSLYPSNFHNPNLIFNKSPAFVDFHRAKTSKINTYIYIFLHLLEYFNFANNRRKILLPSPFPLLFSSRWPPLPWPFRSSISRDRWKKPPSFLSRDPSNIGKMAATLVASVPQRPVQFSFLPFPVLPSLSPSSPTPVSGGQISILIFPPVFFFFSISLSPSLPGSLPLFFIKWRTGCETRNSHPLPPTLEEGHNSPSRKCSSTIPAPRFLDRRRFSKSILNILSTRSSLFRTRYSNLED